MKPLDWFTKRIGTTVNVYNRDSIFTKALPEKMFIDDEIEADYMFQLQKDIKLRFEDLT